MKKPALGLLPENGFLNEKGDKWRLSLFPLDAAADGFRLSVKATQLKQNFGDVTEVIIPARALMELARVSGDQEQPVDRVQPAVMVGDQQRRPVGDPLDPAHLAAVVLRQELEPGDCSLERRTPDPRRCRRGFLGLRSEAPQGIWSC